MKMNMDPKKQSMLAPYTVLDLTDEKGVFCGRILADLGADVLKLEPPGGDPSRKIGPFYKDIVDPEKSIHWFAYNANKRGITLDIKKERGKALFKKMLDRVDILIESSPPGYMENLGLGYHEVSAINPRIIMTSITPFGQSGPYKAYKASDITSMAMGGLMHLTGYPDRSPVRVSAPQAYLQAGSEAAVGTMVALYYRDKSDKGQHVDVSIQESIMFCMLNLHLFWDSHGEIVGRQGDSRIFSSGAKHRQIWPCKDGYVCFTLMGAKAGAMTNRALVKWMDSEGMATDYMKGKDWDSFDFAVAEQEELDLIGEPVGQFFLAHTQEELVRGAAQRGMMFYPVADVSDLMASPHLEARGFWQRISHRDLGADVTYPGHFCIPSDAECGIRRPAPLIGEHNREIYVDEMGLSEEEISILKKERVI
jgi:benzylsuccinate CoA-transferase BbsE subunit/naphthyl-2-methylsuccinate CoA transferase subunit